MHLLKALTSPASAYQRAQFLKGFAAGFACSHSNSTISVVTISAFVPGHAARCAVSRPCWKRAGWRQRPSTTATSDSPHPTRSATPLCRTQTCASTPASDELVAAQVESVCGGGFLVGKTGKGESCHTPAHRQRRHARDRRHRPDPLGYCRDSTIGHGHDGGRHATARPVLATTSSSFRHGGHQTVLNIDNQQRNCGSRS